MQSCFANAHCRCCFCPVCSFHTSRPQWHQKAQHTGLQKVLAVCPNMSGFSIVPETLFQRSFLSADQPIDQSQDGLFSGLPALLTSTATVQWLKPFPGSVAWEVTLTSCWHPQSFALFDFWFLASLLGRWDIKGVSICVFHRGFSFHLIPGYWIYSGSGKNDTCWNWVI